MITRVGFFRELSHGEPDGPSLHDALEHAEDQADRAVIVKYLRSGRVIAAAAGPTHDVLSPDKTPHLPLKICTDGRFVWPADYAYYVDRYRIPVPDALRDVAVDRLGVVPSLSDEDVGRVIGEYLDTPPPQSDDERADA